VLTLLLAAVLVVNLVAVALLEGGEVFVTVAVLPYKETLSEEASLEMHRAMMDERADGYLFPAGGVSLITGIVLVILSLWAQHPLSAAAYAIGAAGMAFTAIISQRTNRSINKQVRPGVISAHDYVPLGRSWHRIHRIRTRSSGVALVSFAVAAALSSLGR
jgi:hypothetical protein